MGATDRGCVTAATLFGIMIGALTLGCLFVIGLALGAD
jgi:hypothetical protein